MVRAIVVSKLVEQGLHVREEDVALIRPEAVEEFGNQVRRELFARCEEGTEGVFDDLVNSSAMHSAL